MERLTTIDKKLPKMSDIRWQCPKCGYWLTKEEIRANLEEGSFDKPSTLIIACPGCIEAIPYLSLKSIRKQAKGGNKK